MIETWEELLLLLKGRFGKEADLKAVLFLIGMREVGKRMDKISKEQKQDMMSLAVCRLLSQRGYFALEGTDEDGWPRYKQTEPMPRLEPKNQEELLQQLSIEYFNEEGIS